MTGLISTRGYCEIKSADSLSPTIVECMERRRQGQKLKDSYNWTDSGLKEYSVTPFILKQNPMEEHSSARIINTGGENFERLEDNVFDINNSEFSSAVDMTGCWGEELCTDEVPGARSFEFKNASKEEKDFHPLKQISTPDHVFKTRMVGQAETSEMAVLQRPWCSSRKGATVQNKRQFILRLRAMREIDREVKRLRSLSDPTNTQNRNNMSDSAFLRAELRSLHQGDQLWNPHLPGNPEQCVSSFIPQDTQNKAEIIADGVIPHVQSYESFQQTISFDLKRSAVVTEQQRIVPTEARRPLVQHDYKDHAFLPALSSSSPQPGALSSLTGSEEENTGSPNSAPSDVSFEIECSCKTNHEVANAELPWESIRRPFPEKLYGVLLLSSHDESLSKVVSWQQHGRSFLVHRPHDFVDLVLKKYFRQSKFTSFQRQLNLYGFKRFSRGLDRGSYYHELFLRGRPCLCQKMVRTRIKGNGIKPAPNPSAEPDFYQMRPCLESDGEYLALTRLQQQPKNSFLDELPNDNRASTDHCCSTNFDNEFDSAVVECKQPTLRQNQVDEVSVSRVAPTEGPPRMVKNSPLQSLSYETDSQQLECSSHLSAQDHHNGSESPPQGYGGINFYSHSLINLACTKTNESSMSKSESPQPYFATDTVDPSYWLPANIMPDGCATSLPCQLGLEQNKAHNDPLCRQNKCSMQDGNTSHNRHARSSQEAVIQLVGTEPVEEDPLLDEDIAGVEPDMLKLFESQFDLSR